MSNKIVELARARLHKIADVNGDGKLTRADVDQVLAPLEEKAKAETVKHPMGALITVAVLGAVIGGVVARSFPC